MSGSFEMLMDCGLFSFSPYHLSILLLLWFTLFYLLPQTEENGKISGLHGYAIYIGALVNDTTVHGILSYHNNQSSATFDELVDINSPELPGVVYDLSAYVNSSRFVNNNFYPIPIEIVNEMQKKYWTHL